MNFGIVIFPEVEELDFVSRRAPARMRRAGHV